MKMNYFVVGTNDMHASKAFYDTLFEGMSLQSMSPSDRMTYWLGEDCAFAVARPFDEKPATNGNGTMVGFCVGPGRMSKGCTVGRWSLAAPAKARPTSVARRSLPM